MRRNVTDLYEIDTGTFKRIVARDHLMHIIEKEWDKPEKARGILCALDDGAIYNAGIAKVRKVKELEGMRRD